MNWDRPFIIEVFNEKHLHVVSWYERGRGFKHMIIEFSRPWERKTLKGGLL